MALRSFEAVEETTSVPATRPDTRQGILARAEAVTIRPGSYALIAQNGESEQNVDPTAEAQNGEGPKTQRSESGEYPCVATDATPARLIIDVSGEIIEVLEK